MIKRLVLILCLIIASQSIVLADEIIDSKGVVIPCKIETVLGGLIEYKKDGNLYTFTRTNDSPIFNDYIDVKNCLYKDKGTTRYTGKIFAKDSWGAIIKTSNGTINIPNYRIKFVGVYKP